MSQATLSKRRQELQQFCEQRKLDWKERIKGLPESDDGVILAALATTLKFNLQGAFRPSKPLAELERESKASEDQAKQLDELRRRLTL
jgi:hypothetical protein